MFRVNISDSRAAYRELSASPRGKRNMLDEAGEIVDVDAVFSQQGHLKNGHKNVEKICWDLWMWIAQKMGFSIPINFKSDTNGIMGILPAIMGA